MEVDWLLSSDMLPTHYTTIFLHATVLFASNLLRCNESASQGLRKCLYNYHLVDQRVEYTYCDI